MTEYFRALRLQSGDSLIISSQLFYRRDFESFLLPPTLLLSYTEADHPLNSYRLNALLLFVFLLNRHHSSPLKLELSPSLTTHLRGNDSFRFVTLIRTRSLQPIERFCSSIRSTTVFVLWELRFGFRFRLKALVEKLPIFVSEHFRTSLVQRYPVSQICFRENAFWFVDSCLPSFRFLAGSSLIHTHLYAYYCFLTVLPKYF